MSQVDHPYLAGIREAIKDAPESQEEFFSRAAAEFSVFHPNERARICHYIDGVIQNECGKVTRTNAQLLGFRRQLRGAQEKLKAANR